MKNLLYIGNKLSKHGKTATAIEMLGPLLEHERYTVAYASDKKNKALRLAHMLFCTIAKASKTDYVLIDTYSTSNFWYAFLISQLCRLLRLRYIPILHGGNLPRRLVQNPKLSQMIFGNAFLNVAPSKYLLDEFLEKGFQNIRLVPNAISISDFKYVQRNRLLPKLLWVRSLADIYNPMMALRTLELVIEQLPDAQLTMVGPDSGHLLQRLQTVAASSGLPITFTGRLTKRQWSDMASNFDIFLNTARTDNTPYSLIEAAALGLAVVSTNVGGIPHLFEQNHNALLIASDDPVAMASAVKQLVDDAQLAQKLTTNARSAAEQFDWANIRRLWLEILQ